MVSKNWRMLLLSQQQTGADLLYSSNTSSVKIKQDIIFSLAMKINRKSILLTYFKDIEDILDSDIELDQSAKNTQYFVGADLEARSQ